jgi:hypothetical protein
MLRQCAPRSLGNNQPAGVAVASGLMRDIGPLTTY